MKQPDLAPSQLEDRMWASLARAQGLIARLRADNDRARALLEGGLPELANRPENVYPDPNLDG